MCAGADWPHLRPDTTNCLTHTDAHPFYDFLIYISGYQLGAVGEQHVSCSLHPLRFVLGLPLALAQRGGGAGHARHAAGPAAAARVPELRGGSGGAAGEVRRPCERKGGSQATHARVCVRVCVRGRVV